MRELYRKSVFPLGSQVALWDQELAELPDDWDEGDIAVRSSRGIAVATAPPEHSEVEVVAVVGDVRPTGKRILTHRIRVGNQGLQIGGIFNADALPWTPGRVHVQVYVDGPPGMPRQVTVVLTE